MQRPASTVHAALRTYTMQPLATIATGENLPEQPAMKMRKTQMESLRVKKLSEKATLPRRGSAGAAGYDLARYVVFLFNSSIEHPSESRILVHSLTIY